eukprot:183698-Prymnesium_polylepis.2
MPRVGPVAFGVCRVWGVWRLGYAAGPLGEGLCAWDGVRVPRERESSACVTPLFRARLHHPSIPCPLASPLYSVPACVTPLFRARLRHDPSHSPVPACATPLTRCRLRHPPEPWLPCRRADS